MGPKPDRCYFGHLWYISQLHDFDVNLHRSLEGIVGSSISDSAWLQATLPIQLGGLGLREVRRSSSAAFLASCNFSCQLSSRLLSQRSYGPQSYSDKLELNEFPGEQVAREHLCRLLPDISSGLIQPVNTICRFRWILDCSLL